MELTVKIIIGSFLAVASLTVGALLGHLLGWMIGAEGLLMVLCECGVAGYFLSGFVNAIVEAEKDETAGSRGQS